MVGDSSNGGRYDEEGFKDIFPHPQHLSRVHCDIVVAELHISGGVSVTDKGMWVSVAS